MQVIFFVAYIVMGFVQFFATMDGLEQATGISGFFNVIVSFFLAYVPVVGAITGVYGAVAVWDWNILLALALFFWPLLFALVASIPQALESRR
ncbi:hypothetical protein [Ruegeria sp. MALMAid1280]|uniref:hypothetical protein n=1 Tax=Ruegeria sp. MALMAid1280 TaxID=3411634 RepID=UPI003BA06281